MTVLVFAVVTGALLGLGLLGFAGLWIGAALGALASWVYGLNRRVGLLEQQARATKPARKPTQRPEPAEPFDIAAPQPTTSPPRAPMPQPAPVAQSAAGMERAAERTAEPAPAAARDVPPIDAATREHSTRQVEQALEPSLLETAFGHVTRWFTTGNVPVKVGVVLSVFGVGFLVKEGYDRQWFVLPIEFRLALAALFGIALLAFGWRLRHRNPTYALSVQGGGIAVLYLTTYAAFAEYQLLPATLAFVLLVIVTAAAGALAVLQDTRTLAVLGIVGGFMAPVLTSTDTGNHVALFSYYAILNFAILGIAWFKAWRELNVLGFLFTFVIGSLWGYDAYEPRHFATTEPFLVLFVLLYTLIPALFALRSAPNVRGFVDGTLVFGTPLVGFGLQSQLVGDTRYGLAISAIALAALYIGLATILHKRRAAELRVLIESQFALSIAFLTVAVPLAFDDAAWTSAAWALQGAAMVWLGFRQGRKLALVAGLLLQLLSGAAFLQQLDPVGAWPVLNGYVMGALLLAFAGAFSGRAFDSDRDEETPHPELRNALASGALLVWAGGWWYFAGFAEIDRTIGFRLQQNPQLLFAAGTTVLALLAAARFGWRRLNALGLVLWPLAVLGWLTGSGTPSVDLGWLAWPAVVVAMYTFLRAREKQFPVLAGGLHLVAYWLAASLLARELYWQLDGVAEGVWPVAAVLALGALVTRATLAACERIPWPFGAHADSYLSVGCGCVLAVLTGAMLVANVTSSGDATPLPYLPLFNPLEVASVLSSIVLLRWLSALQRQRPQLGLEARHFAAVAAGLGWFLLTMAVARAVHHWAEVPFNFDDLSASTVLQASLSIVWGVSGLAAMLIGARHRRRVVWLAGAALMAIVVGKLFVVDLGNTGTLARVVSFLGVGLLLLVVGYFAPVPPRGEIESRAE